MRALRVMKNAATHIQAIEGVKPDQIPFESLFAAGEPVLMPGLVKDWPLTRAGRRSAEEAMGLMREHYSGKPVVVYVGAPEIRGRFGYDESCTMFNFQSRSMGIPEVFDRIAAGFGSEEHPFYYINSLMYDDGFPNLRESNDIRLNHPIFDQCQTVAKTWIGTESRASAHFDIPANIVCCAVGRRRFTLFPPEQIHNLYPGPLNLTPGGQVITMVDLREPDLEKYPLFERALAAAIVVKLEPGDALYYPSMWWHEVEALDPFNVMINYWWSSAPRYMGNPMDALMHAMLGLRDRPDAVKQAWRELFDYYVFGSPEKTRAHLPGACHGALAEMDENLARRLRALLQQNLNR